MIQIFMTFCWFWLLFTIGKAGFTPGSVIFLLIFLYLILDIKHPCDYNSYSEWWQDRKNWNNWKD